MPPLRDIVVGVAFCIVLRGPGRVPGFSPWSSPVPPPLSSRSMSAAGAGFIYLLFIQLGARSYGRYRKEISINKSSKTDIRKQARNPPGRRLPQPIRAQLYKN